MSQRPGLRTLLFGSYFTAPVIMAGSALYTWHWWAAGGPDNTGLVAIGLFLVSAKALSKVAAYKRWRADWEAMSPDAKPKRFKFGAGTVAQVLAIILAGIVGLYASSPDAPPELHGWIVLCAVATLALVALVMAFRLLRRVWPKRRQRPTPLASVVVQRPVLPVPTIREAYQHLPDYCLQLLKRQAS